jgi:hypothetical protein
MVETAPAIRVMVEMTTTMDFKDIENIIEDVKKPDTMSDLEFRKYREKIMNNLVILFINRGVTEQNAEALFGTFLELGVILNHYTKEDVIGIQGRRDERSRIVFFSEIRSTTKIEFDVFKEFIDICRKNSIGIIFRDTGADNTGGIIIKKSDTSGIPDYGVTILTDTSPIGQDGFVEIKTCPTDSFHTFKKVDIDTYASISGCYMVCAYKSKNETKVKKYYIYNPSVLQYLSTLTPRIYRTKDEKCIMGCKPSIRCWQYTKQIEIDESETSFEILKEMGLQIIENI